MGVGTWVVMELVLSAIHLIGALAAALPVALLGALLANKLGWLPTAPAVWLSLEALSGVAGAAAVSWRLKATARAFGVAPYRPLTIAGRVALCASVWPMAEMVAVAGAPHGMEGMLPIIRQTFVWLVPVATVALGVLAYEWRRDRHGGAAENQQL